MTAENPPVPPRPAFTAAGVMYLGAVTDIDGRRVEIWRDHDAVRIDAGGQRFTFPGHTAVELAAILTAGYVTAQAWARAQDPGGPDDDG